MENKDYKELVDFIGGQFTNVERQFDRVWTEFIKVHGKLDHLSENKADKSDARELLGSIDAYAHKADTYFMEMAALGNKLDRHERWINAIAEKLGLKLPS